jgi:hypothetical protein
MGLLIILAGLILAAVLVSTLRRSSTQSARVLLKDVALWPARDGSARDHWTAALRLGLLLVAFWFLSFGFFGVADRWPANSAPSNSLSFVGLLFGFGGFVLFGLAMREVSRARGARRLESRGGAA